jgi:hypothetical protein
MECAIVKASPILPLVLTAAFATATASAGFAHIAALYLGKGDRAAARADFERAAALEPGEAYCKRRLQEMSASPSPR